MQAVRHGSEGRVPLSTGSFYRHLAKLIDGGLVAESTVRRAGDDPRRGAYYRLTALGHRVLTEERQRLLSLVAAIDELTPVPQKRHA
jgi:DNA-binding PadR family transcriptional regulator